jgi:hypothetical protein
MLDLKAKLLAAGIVTAEQVKKVETEEAEKKRRDAERREAHRLAREGKKHGGDKRHGDKKPFDRKKKDADEKRAERDHKEEDAQRWRKRLDELKAAGKSEQYDAVRGWVARHRIDDKTAVPSENATRFHFARADGTIGHVTLEPDVQAKLAAGEAGIIAFMGFNGLEHAVVPADLARDVAHVKPEWLRSLVGVTDVTPPEPVPVDERMPEEPAADVEAPALESAPADAGEGEPQT